MYDLHTHLPLVTEDDIEIFRTEAPVFASALQALRESGALQTIVDALILRGYGDDAEAVLERFLHEEVSAITERPRHIALSDLNGGATAKSPAEMRVLELAAQGSRSSAYKLTHRILGSLSHRVVSEILSGRLPTENALPQTERDALSAQLALIASTTTTQAEQVAFGEEKFSTRSPGSVFHNGQFRKPFIDELRVLLEEIWPTLGQEGESRTVSLFSYQHNRNLLVRLAELLSPVVGETCITPFLHGDMRDQELFLLTLVNWGTAIQEYHRRGPRILFSEITALSRSMKIEGGKIDALEVTALDGEKVSAKEEALLRHVLTEYRTGPNIKSSGQLLARIRHITGKVPTIRVLDWKFGVGDAVTGEILPASTRIRPPQKHVSQVQRYLSLVAVDFAHVSGFAGDRRLGSRSIQRQFPLAEEACLVYFLNTPLPPVVHRVCLGASRRAELLRNMHARIADATRLGNIRLVRKRLCVLGLDMLAPTTSLH